MCGPKPHGLRLERRVLQGEIGTLLLKEEELIAGLAEPRSDFHQEKQVAKWMAPI